MTWPAGLHRQAGSGPGGRPGRQIIPRIPMEGFRTRVRGVPLQPAQAQGIIPAGGALTVTIGPTGAGNVWYPAQVTVSTTTGVNDTSVFNLFLGPSGVPITLVGTCFGGAGTISLAIPPMTPGQYLIGQWTGANPGDLTAMNVVGVMDALTA